MIEMGRLDIENWRNGGIGEGHPRGRKLENTKRGMSTIKNVKRKAEEFATCVVKEMNPQQNNSKKSGWQADRKMRQGSFLLVHMGSI